MHVCYNCGAELHVRRRVPFKELCPNCDAFIHCCRNCRLYDPTAHHHCISHTTEFVPDVERSNYCDEFEIRTLERPRSKAAEAAQAAGATTAKRAKRKKKGGRRSGEAENGSNAAAKAKFDSLFKD
jgi:predicted RNA-binding Zn-ribbon protein involved in translation (DUF1610 family)